MAAAGMIMQYYWTADNSINVM